ncbi:MAG: response regulator [Methanothrix sp.]|nr:MAG: response regulator [Methanothrix sp.]
MMNITAIGHLINDIEPLFQFLSALMWPLLILFIILLFKSKIDDLIDSAKLRKFTIKAANFELTMEDAIKQQQQIIKDFQDKILQGKTKPKNLTSLLWVDDNPKNNAMLIQNFTEKGISITTASSTKEALLKMETEKFDAIITDMGRTESGERLDTAGIDLSRKIRENDKNIPIFIYSWSKTAKSKMDEAKDAGITKVTTSKSDLIEALWSL